ncbi:MAG: 3-phosphoserine/phosphohydroxythreonine transaminase [Bacteroidales bacterium]|nr:3-phosphoserine/phosphohydroxythreonine transaminase [Bacteroidales bacterium]
MNKHNFNAGPAILSPYVIENTAKGVLNYNDTGLSVMEISHRSKEFAEILGETKILFKELMEIPAGYSIIFVQGGASMNFAMVPFNLLKTKAAYLHTGAWASKAMKEATYFGEVVVAGSSADRNFSYIPKKFEVPSDCDYFHITSNNTIYGTQIKTDYSVDVPLIADMSSDILCRKVDVSKYSLIYAGVQKNIGPSGMAVAIIKDDILGKVDRYIPTMLNYKTHIDQDSLYNTPPTLTIYACLQTFRWLKSIGGIDKMYKMNVDKARLLYDEIDRNPMFVGTVDNNEDRSLMNVTFVMNNNYKDLEKEFLDYATQNGMVGIKGHRTVGGFRASIYNAMTKESIQALVDLMKAFEKKHK